MGDLVGLDAEEVGEGFKGGQGLLFAEVPFVKGSKDVFELRLVDF